MKRERAYLLPPEWDANQSHVPPPPPQEIRCTHFYTMRVISLAQERNAGTNVPGPSTPIGNFPGSKPKLEAKTQRIIVRTLAYKQSILFIWVCEVLKI